MLQFVGISYYFMQAPNKPIDKQSSPLGKYR